MAVGAVSANNMGGSFYTGNYRRVETEENYSFEMAFGSQLNKIHEDKYLNRDEYSVAKAYQYTSSSHAVRVQSESVTDSDEVDTVSEERIEPLGIGFLNVGNMGYGMSASQVISGDTDDTIIRVKISLGGGNTEIHDVNLSKVDPRNATAIEMFAYCQYADATGKGVNSTFGSWNALKHVLDPMNNGMAYPSLDEAVSSKRNWTLALQNSTISLEHIKTGNMISASDLLDMLKTVWEEAAEKDNMPDDNLSDEEWKNLLASVDAEIEAFRDGVKEQAESAEADRFKRIIAENKANGKIRPAMGLEEFLKLQDSIVSENLKDAEKHKISNKERIMSQDPDAANKKYYYGDDPKAYTLDEFARMLDEYEDHMFDGEPSKGYRFSDMI